MPIAFVGTQVSAEDRRTAEEIMANASEHVTKVTREVGQLRSFMHANNFGPDIEDGEILVLFAAQWKNAGRSLATANQIIQDFRTHGVRPREADLADQKLRHERALNALKRSAARAERRYRVIPLERVVSPFRRPDKGTHADRWAFWFLLIVTGNRAYNVLELRALRATADYLDVDWGPRKVHSNTTARYYYWWSGTPPPWIIARWNNLHVEKWPWSPGLLPLSSLDKPEQHCELGEPLDQGVEPRSIHFDIASTPPGHCSSPSRGE
jgi:hypothetical protein